MTNPGYVVHDHCHVCGEMHLVAAPLCLPAGLTKPCTLADLYPGGDMPPAIVDFRTDSLLWCDQAGDYIERSDPARIHLTPPANPITDTAKLCLQSRLLRSTEGPGAELVTTKEKIRREDAQ